jgi:PAS domain S-box-containing protein
LLDHVDDSVFATDGNAVVTYWNSGAQKTFGYAAQEMIGKPISRLSPHKNKGRDLEMHLEILTRGTSVSREWEGRHKSGALLFLRLSYLPMRDKDGQLLGLACIGKDISEQKNAEAALRTSEIRYRRLFEAARDGILLLDAKTGRITDVNPYLLEMLGYSREEIIGRALWQIGAPKDEERSRAGFKTMQAKGYVHYENIPLQTKDGRLIDFEFVSNIYLVDGVKVAQCNIRDISTRRIAEAVLRKSEDMLLEKNALLEQKNVALREMMDQVREEKLRLQTQVQANAENLMMPIIEKMKGETGDVAGQYVVLLEANLKEITSSFGNAISSAMFKLTQKEIDVCNMIRGGFSSKEISDSLFISSRTVETHRNNIRRKLAISGKDVNLATYLKHLQ